MKQSFVEKLRALWIVWYFGILGWLLFGMATLKPSNVSESLLLIGLQMILGGITLFASLGILFGPLPGRPTAKEWANCFEITVLNIFDGGWNQMGFEMPRDKVKGIDGLVLSDWKKTVPLVFNSKAALFKFAGSQAGIELLAGCGAEGFYATQPPITRILSGDPKRKDGLTPLLNKGRLSHEARRSSSLRSCSRGAVLGRNRPHGGRYRGFRGRSAGLGGLDAAGGAHMSIRRYRAPSKPAQGSRNKNRVSLVTHYDEDLFAALRAFAARERVSAGEAVRTQVTWGLESAGEQK